MYVRMYVSMYVCMHACMYVCMHVCIKSLRTRFCICQYIEVILELPAQEQFLCVVFSWNSTGSNGE